MRQIAIAGTGYVGLSLAVLLARYNSVTAVDIVPEKVKAINEGKSPISDGKIEEYLPKVIGKTLHATLDAQAAYKQAEIIVVCTPTNYDPETHQLETRAVDAVLKLVEEFNPQATVVIKSTCPMGYLEKQAKTRKLPNLLFSPEFLREGHALEDNLHPSRIIVGTPKGATEELKRKAAEFASMLKDAALDEDVPILIVNATEAETIKLFANTYLALRVSFFNELDSFAQEYNLETKQILQGVCLDPRIGDYYNNPSFGYGGYCLPKDTKELLACYGTIPQRLMKSVVESNQTRKEFMVKKVLERKPKTVGIYRLTMKSGSDNFREAATLDILRILKEKGKTVIIYEPLSNKQEFEGCQIVESLDELVQKSDVVMANRLTDEIIRLAGSKLYSRDVYGSY